MWRRSASKGRLPPVSKNKHAFLDPRGWSIFPRPALREDAKNPRSPFHAHRFFLREIEYQRSLSALESLRRGTECFAESLPRLCIEVRHAQVRGLQFVDSLQAGVTCKDELWQ